MAVPSLRLADACVPALLPGEYSITAGYHLATNPEHSEHTTQKLRISAARYALQTTDVLRCFPPPGAVGGFSTTLPHVALSRPTLPWERQPAADHTGPRPPWLAVLVFEPGELIEDPLALGHTRRTTVGEWQHDGDSLHATLDGAQTDGTIACRTISMSVKTFKAVRPLSADLPYVAHVREAKPGIGAIPGELAVVVGNRLPKQPLSGGAEVPHVAHLVSLEGVTGFLDPRWSPDPAGPRSVRLLSLHSWTFANRAVPHPPFTATLKALTAEAAAQPVQGLLRLDSAPAGRSMDAPSLQQGYVPVLPPDADHARVLRYRGPFSPAAPPGTPPTDGPQDISHADARALGRAMALADTSLFSAIDAAHPDAGRAGTDHHDALAGLLSSGVHTRLGPALSAHGTGPQPTAYPPPGPSLPLRPVPHAPDTAEAAEVLADGLFSLRTVPFCHLLPAPGLLPPETIRFFHVDESWVGELVNGAADLLNSRPGAAELVRQLAADAVTKGRRATGLGDQGHRTGVLIRSRLISQYHGLHLYAGTPTAQVRVRAWNPAPEILLCLFDSGSDVTWFEIAEPAHALHFGFELAGQQVTLPLRDEHGTRTGTSLGQGKVLRPGGTTVLFAGLAAAAQVSDPSGLALQLIRTPVRQFFGQKPAQIPQEIQ
ncbi:hypothetical protein [Streptomyces sp. G1]|uniref:hypothetical protein n=1 Tax=Streptomyces sp. G1 TaxID=361572 RepID=UPI00202FC07F|nr:hypothetical protein [Streptomyces sp. G1]MCM1965097.1 hypothetical protein [Streptomyces sp. G1]